MSAAGGRWLRLVQAALGLGLVVVLAVLAWYEFRPAPLPTQQQGAPLGPGLDEAPEARRAYNRGLYLLQSGQNRQAAEALEQAAEAAPWHAPSWNNLGVALSRLGRSQEALRAFHRACIADPHYVPGYLNQANLESTLGLEDQARQTLAQGLERSGPVPSLAKAMAAKLIARGEFARTAELLRKSRQRHPSASGLAEMEALALVRLQKWREAEALLEDLAQKADQGLEARRILSRMRLQQGRLAEARQLSAEIVEQSGGNRADVLALRSAQLARREHGVVVLPLVMLGQAGPAAEAADLRQGPAAKADAAGRLEAGQWFMPVARQGEWWMLLAWGRPGLYWTKGLPKMRQAAVAEAWPTANAGEGQDSR